MSNELRQPGRLLKAPESFHPLDFVQDVNKHGFDENRRSILRQSFAAAAAAMTGSVALDALATDGFVDDPDILESSALVDIIRAACRSSRLRHASEVRDELDAA